LFFVAGDLPDRPMRTHVANSARLPVQRLPRRRGVTLIETIIAVSLMTFAASALLTALSSTVQVSTDSLHAAIANGLADQLMDEIASVKFPSASGTGSGSGMGRTGFADLDAYNGYNVSPPQARNGMTIGTEGANSSGSAVYRPQQFQPNPKLLSGYRQQVAVEKVAESGTSWSVVSQSSTLRRVTVTISYTDSQGTTTPAAVQVRIFSNVAVAP
jgi:Tfp pilus assembly protein PilV